jgi:hypothetical protein
VEVNKFRTVGVLLAWCAAQMPLDAVAAMYYVTTQVAGYTGPIEVTAQYLQVVAVPQTYVDENGVVRTRFVPQVVTQSAGSDNLFARYQIISVMGPNGQPIIIGQAYMRHDSEMYVDAVREYTFPGTYRDANNTLWGVMANGTVLAP